MFRRQNIVNEQNIKLFVSSNKHTAKEKKSTHQGMPFYYFNKNAALKIYNKNNHS